MEFETMKAMNEGMYPGLLTIMEAIALITVFFAIAALVISLCSIAWLCFKESHQPSRNQVKPAAGPDQYDPLPPLAALNNELGDGLISSAARRKPAFQRISIK